MARWTAWYKHKRNENVVSDENICNGPDNSDEINANNYVVTIAYNNYDIGTAGNELQRNNHRRQHIKLRTDKCNIWRQIKQ